MAERIWVPDFKPPPDAEKDPYKIDRKGIISWRNKRNGFFVGAIHCTADPEKRDEEWFKEASKRFRPDQIAREWDISFKSRAGQKAFSYLAENPGRWQIPNIPLDQIPKNWRIIASLDYGTTNPTAIYFFGIDQKRRFYALYEFYKPSSVREIASVLKGNHKGEDMDGTWTDYRHPLWRRCERIVVDGAIFKKDQDQGGEGHVSIGDLLEEQGIHIMERATKDRLAGLERVKDMLAPSIADPEQKPSLFFTKRCHNLWREMLDLVYDELPPHLLLNKNQKEDVVAKDDHAYDSLRYALMAIHAPSDEMPEPEPETGTMGHEEALLDKEDAEDEEIDYL